MDFDNLFGSLEEKYGLPKGYLSRTRQIESSNGKNVYNPKSGAAGDFQFIPRTAKQYGLTNPYDINQSAEAAARLAADNKAALAQAGIQNPDGAQLYLAHQQGAGGAVKLLNGGDAPAANLVGKNAVNWNGGNGSMNGPQMAQNVMGMYSGDSPRERIATASPAQQVAAANPASAPPGLDNQPKDGTALGDVSPGLLGGLTSDKLKGSQGLLGQIQKQQSDDANRANQQTQMLWQMASKGGNTQPMTPFTGFQQNIFGNGLLG